MGRDPELNRALEQWLREVQADSTAMEKWYRDYKREW